MGFTDSDPRRGEFTARIAELQKSLVSGHPTIDRHFVYHEVIEGLYRLDDMDRMIEYCYRELDEWPALGDELRKDDPEHSLPPVIACRDRLLDALLRREDYDAANHLAQILIDRRVVDSQEEVDLIREDTAVRRLRGRVLDALCRRELVSADEALGGLLCLAPNSSAETLKWFGNQCLEAGDDRRALAAYQAAMDADPLLPGVKDKLRRLGRKLGAQVRVDAESVRAELERRVLTASRWEEKRDLAWKFVEVGLNDRAWGLLNETLLSCFKQRDSQETVYLMMARVLEKEERYEHAILHVGLALWAQKRHGVREPSRRAVQILSRCLKRGAFPVTSEAVLRVANTRDFDRMRDGLSQLLRHAGVGSREGEKERSV